MEIGFGSREKTAGSGEQPPDDVASEAALQTQVDDLDVQGPAHTTERKLLAKIDCHVVPWLCIMYLLAFLGEF